MNFLKNIGLISHRYPKFLADRRFVDSALILRDHKSDIEKFHLSWNPDCLETDTIVNHLNTWITAALNRNVVEVSVVIGGLFDSHESEDDIVTHYFSCNLLFNCATLAKLELKVDIEIRKETEDDGSTFPKSMDLPCLRVLKLESIDIYNANNLLVRNNCHDMEWFNIESLTLKYLKLENFIMRNKIMLNVPNLQTFICVDYSWRKYSMENISSLVCARIEMLDSHEKELCVTRAIDFLKALDTVNELQLSRGILENLFSNNSTLNEDLTEQRISYRGNTK
ncbi:hypothetical protein MKX01_003317 [Papaver californicum]|nr:hypothetical protein MKX01_003317 [Papaver californicum]